MSRHHRRAGVVHLAANGAPDLAGGHSDQHQVHGRFPEPVLGCRRCPARQWHLLPVGTAYSGSDDIDLAALIADLAARAAPAVTTPLWASRMSPTAKVLDIGGHHGLQRFYAGGQTKASEAGVYSLPRFFHAGRDSERA
jgi:hypothetical protein